MVPTATPTSVSDVLGARPGDANCSGSIGPLDALLILQLGAGMILALPCDGGGDANGDGVIDIVDATLILQYVLGMISTLPP